MRAVPRLWEFYPGICLTTEDKAWINLRQGKKNLSQSTVYILPKHPHITKPTHTHTHARARTHTHTHTTIKYNTIQYHHSTNENKQCKSQGSSPSTSPLPVLHLCQYFTSPSTSPLPCQYRYTNAPFLSPSTCCSYHKDKGAGLWNLPKNALLGIGCA